NREPVRGGSLFHCFSHFASGKVEGRAMLQTGLELLYHQVEPWHRTHLPPPKPRPLRASACPNFPRSASGSATRRTTSSRCPSPPPRFCISSFLVCWC